MKRVEKNIAAGTGNNLHKKLGNTQSSGLRLVSLSFFFYPEPFGKLKDITEGRQRELYRYI